MPLRLQPKAESPESGAETRVMRTTVSYRDVFSLVENHICHEDAEDITTPVVALQVSDLTLGTFNRHLLYSSLIRPLMTAYVIMHKRFLAPQS